MTIVDIRKHLPQKEAQRVINLLRRRGCSTNRKTGLRTNEMTNYDIQESYETFRSCALEKNKEGRDKEFNTYWCVVVSLKSLMQAGIK